MLRYLRIVAPVFLATLVASSACATVETYTHAPLEETLVLRVDGELTIDSQGTLADYRIMTPLPQVLSDALQSRLRTWHFEPTQINGKPSVVRTRMRITLTTVKNDGKHPIRIDHVLFSRPSSNEPEASDDTPNPVTMSLADGNTVRYPFAGISREINADALVYVLVTPEGRVGQAIVAQSALLNVTGRQSDLQAMIKQFEDETISDVKDFRFRVSVDQAKLAQLRASDPDEVAAAFTGRFPVLFVMVGSRNESGGSWQQEVRTPLRMPPWIKKDFECGWPGVADLTGSDGLVQSSNCPHLTTPVVGTTL